MRINKFLAAATPLSRRAADVAVRNGRVTVDGQMAINGTEVTETSRVKLDGKPVIISAPNQVVLFNKPAGVVCSRNGQGSRTIFDVIPAKYHHLQAVGRLDKDSSGLLVLTNDGDLAEELTHPRNGKVKKYLVRLDTVLQPLHQQMIADYGVTLEDGKSSFTVARSETDTDAYEITMREGRNRQIRRTFAALGYQVQYLHRTDFGPYNIGDLPSGETREVSDQK